MKQTNIARHTAAASATWKYLAHAEELSGVSLLDVEFDARHLDGGLEVKVTLMTGDAPTPEMVSALRRIADDAGVEAKQGIRYTSSTQPSGWSISLHVHLTYGIVSIHFQGLFDAEEYDAALTELGAAAVPTQEPELVAA